MKQPRSALRRWRLVASCGWRAARAAKRAHEYMPDMARGPAYKAFAPNAATRTGLTLQRPVAGTIARGRLPFHYGPGEPEAARAGRELVNPLPIAPVTIEDGRGLYQTYCLVCHGAAGKGDGPLAAAARSRRRPPTRPNGSSRSRPAGSSMSSRWAPGRCRRTRRC